MPDNNSYVYEEYDVIDLVQNYIYLHHLDKYVYIPTWPDTVKDDLQSTFKQTEALARTAPVFTYSNSGPRQITVQFDLHREMVDEINTNNAAVRPEYGDDYVDYLIKALQSAALPKYTSDTKFLEPPMVSMRLSNEIFIKGVISGSVSVSYSKPLIIKDGKEKYAQVAIGFTMYEVTPYDAETVYEQGSFRGYCAAASKDITV